jgi:membrane protein
MIKKITHFITNDLWKADVDEMSKSRFFLVQQLRIFVLAIRGFNEDNILLRASALTFYTLISIVPVIALSFAISKGFGFEEMLNEQIHSYFDSQKGVSEVLIGFSHSFLENTKGGVVAGIGVVMLLWSVIKVLSNVELSFNAIWGITKPRSIIRKFTEYLAIMLIAPVFIILSGGITVYISSATSHVLSNDSIFYHLGSVFQILIELIPYILDWLLFTFLYLAMPNTKVEFKHAFFAGIIAGTAFQILEWTYITFQIGVVQYSAIYGSFAALPMFLVWLQSSWLIVLFGCEIAFASQNVKQYIYENEVNNISQLHKKKITLYILLVINKNFNEGKPAFTVNSLCAKLKLPVRLVQNIINELLEIGLVMEANTDKHKLVGYTPARELNNLFASELIALLENKGSNEVPVQNNEEWNWASSVIDEFNSSNDNSSLNKQLQEWLKVEKR